MVKHIELLRGFIFKAAVLSDKSTSKAGAKFAAIFKIGLLVPTIFGADEQAVKNNTVAVIRIFFIISPTFYLKVHHQQDAYEHETLLVHRAYYNSHQTITVFGDAFFFSNFSRDSK